MDSSSVQTAGRSSTVGVVRRGSSLQAVVECTDRVAGPGRSAGDFITSVGLEFLVKRFHLVLLLTLVVVADVLLAVYVFAYSTDTLSPTSVDVEGITVLDRSINGLLSIGTEDGRIITYISTFQNEAPITSLLAADDGQMVAYSDSMNRVHLYLSLADALIWTKAFDEPVDVVEMWTRQGAFFLEPTYILVKQERGFTLLNGLDGTTAWSHSSDEPFILQAAENGKMIMASGSRASFFWLGDAEPYRWIPVEGPVEEAVIDAKGLDLLILTPSEAVFYDAITGEVGWRRDVAAGAQVALSWDGSEAFLLSAGRLQVISRSGEVQVSRDVGSGQLLVPSASPYHFMLRNDRIDAYYRGRPAPIWLAHIESPRGVHSDPGGSAIFAWTSDKLYTLSNTGVQMASRTWMGVLGTVVTIQVLVVSIFLVVSHFLPNVGDLLAALIVGAIVSVAFLVTGALGVMAELGVGGALIGVMLASAVAALFGRKSGGGLAGGTIGLAVGLIGFLAASLLIAFYLYVFGILPTFPAIEISIRSLGLGWILGLAAGFLGGVSASFIPSFLRSASSRT